jgi:hypothetical protein
MIQFAKRRSLTNTSKLFFRALRQFQSRNFVAKTMGTKAGFTSLESSLFVK